MPPPNVTGVTTLGNNVALTISTFGGFDPTGGTYYILTREDGGTFGATAFAGLAENSTVNIGGGYTGQITYLADWNGTQASSTIGGGNDVAIFNVIPEPSSYAMLLGGFGMLVAFQRSRRGK